MTEHPCIPDHRVYRLYTEYRQNLLLIVSRYFGGATILPADGVWQGETEDAAVIEIIAREQDLQSIVNLAGDIKYANHQSLVIVTWQPINRLDV